jgi:hypothetical protein
VNIDKALDPDFRGKPLKEVCSGPARAIWGVLPSDGEVLEKAFGIKSVRDMGTNKFFLRAQAIAVLAEKEAAE